MKTHWEVVGLQTQQTPGWVVQLPVSGHKTLNLKHLAPKMQLPLLEMGINKLN